MSREGAERLMRLLIARRDVVPYGKHQLYAALYGASLRTLHNMAKTWHNH